MKKVTLTLMGWLCLFLSYWQTYGQLVNANASAETRGLKAYLDETYGKQIISGQYWNTWADYVKTNTGKTPAILGLDFMDYTPRRRQEGANPTDTEKAIEWTNNRNGIVTFSWHWDAPTDIYDAAFRAECQSTTGGDARWYKAFYSCATYFDVNDALNNPGGTKYNLLIRDIDIVAAELKKLRDAKVPVLWRPLHEAAGQWFWWGAKGPGPCKRLWALMYDRLTNFHQLNNLIWVWNCYGNQYGSPMDWFPGYNMVDIIAYDYPRGTSWSEYNSIHGGKGKLFSLAEVAGLPDPNNFSSASWSYFVTWGDFIKNNNSVDYINRVYNDPKVVTLESLPNWKTYGFANNIALNKPVKVSSTETGFGNIATNINDGNGLTRWSSAYADPQWVEIDLGGRKNISKVLLNWEAASAKSYTLEISNDGITWTVLANRTNMAAGARNDTYTGLNATGRYIRVHGTTRNTTFGYSLYEIKVEGTDAPGGPVAHAGADITQNDANNNGTETIQLNGSASTLQTGTTATYSWSLNGVQIATGIAPSISLAVGQHTLLLTVTDNNGLSSTDQVVVSVTAYVAPNLALNKPVSVSSTEAGFGNVATLAVDGNPATRWSSLYADPQWIRIDLQNNYQITRLVLLWETASARDYRIESSIDGTSWTTVLTRTAQATGARTDNLTNLSFIGRYIRVYGTARTSTYGYSLFEIQAYGNLAIGVNLPPIANAGADINVTDQDNSGTETVSLKGDASSDPDGSVVSYAWKQVSGTLVSSLANPSFNLPVGTHTFTLTVADNEGASAQDQVTVIIAPKVSCTLNSLFGTPSATSLPSIANRSFSRVHVLGNGPSLSNVSSAVIQWEAQYNGLWQFAFNTNNGTPAWYLNLIPLSAHTFNQANPACRFTGTGIAKLDGDYWVKMDGTNFVMVAKTGSHALYFSNSATPPVGCPQARMSLAFDQETTTLPLLSPTRLQTNQWLSISLPEGYEGSEISILNANGHLIQSVYAESETQLFLDSRFTQGIYLVHIHNTNKSSTQRILIE